MKTQTKQSQSNVSPSEVKTILVNGNKRFTQNLMSKRDYNSQVTETSNGQYPLAVVLGCIDSRVPAEIVFDQGIGDIFNVRVAGNIVNEDILGSMEYGCKVAGSKLILVLGHTKCGAVTSACRNVELGNITTLLQKIQPAINSIESTDSEMSQEQIEKVAIANVTQSIEEIRSKSQILSEMEQKGEIEIIGGIYSVETGQVDFI